MAEIERTRYGESAKDIARDFAEQLKYNQDADVYHTTKEGRYVALSLNTPDKYPFHSMCAPRIREKMKGMEKRRAMPMAFMILPSLCRLFSYS